MNLQTILALMPKIGPVVAALPEFKALVMQIMAGLTERDQATLQRAYDLAISDARKAHGDLQALVAQHG